MDLLKKFYNDIHTRNAVMDFQISLLQELAVERVFSKEDVAGICEAKKIIEDSFNKLEELYAIKGKKEPESPR